MSAKTTDESSHSNTHHILPNKINCNHNPFMSPYTDTVYVGHVKHVQGDFLIYVHAGHLIHILKSPDTCSVGHLIHTCYQTLLSYTYVPI